LQLRSEGLDRGYVGPGKVVTFEEEPLVEGDGKRVRRAVSQVQSSRMPAFAVLAPC